MKPNGQWNKHAEAIKANQAAKEFNPFRTPSIQEWFQIARARGIAPLSMMDPGVHLNLGQGNRPINEATPLDLERGWNGMYHPIPAEDNSVAGIWAHAFLDYLPDPVFCLRECERVLKPGGVMNICGPHGLSDLWAEDMLRKTRFTEETWSRLFDNPWYSPSERPWQFEVHVCFIMGVNWRNLSLFTQLVKRDA
jgi:SAM-dependent methyltransferase